MSAQGALSVQFHHVVLHPPHEGDTHPIEVGEVQAHAGDRVVGTLPYHAAPKTVFIQGLHVEPEVRGQGVASRLMDHLIEHAAGRVVDHGERTRAGRDWWKAYKATREVNPRQHRGGKLAKRDLY